MINQMYIKMENKDLKKTRLVFGVILETNFAVSIPGVQNAYWTLGSVYVGEKHSDKHP